MFRLLNPDIELTTLTIFHILLTLRLLPALQQMTSNIRAAAASAWAIKDIQNLFNMSMRSKLSYRPKDLWDCRINFEKEDSNILEILIKKVGNQDFDNIILYPGVVNSISGMSGAGKSTLLKAILEKLQENENWNSSIKNKVGYLPQEPVAFIKFCREHSNVQKL